MNLRSVMSPFIARGAAALLALAGTLSCNTIFTDQSDCPKGVSLRFVYDYNMEYVNSFHKQGHCVNVFVFDEAGNFVDNWTETSEAVKDENWRMNRTLDAGNYTLIAYGGLCCGETSFVSPQFTSRATSNNEEPAVVLKHTDFVSESSLHPLFFGTATLEIGNEDFIEKTIFLKKDTNNIRFILQQVDGKLLNASDFEVSIVDDNSTLGLDNEPVPAGPVTYRPWASGEETIGSAEDGETPIYATWFELSTSRLTTSTSAKLIVRRASDGETIINIPLNNYLLLLKSELYAEMPAQEFLDRISEWSLVFFLDNGLRWISTRIVVNDWVVRINNTDL